MKRVLAGLALFVLMISVVVSLPGQTMAPGELGVKAAPGAKAAAPEKRVAGPKLVVKDAEQGAAPAVTIESVDIRATLVTPLAETSITLVFCNHSNRQLDGELEFPLPEGAVITGYALDIPAGSGKLVEGVAIEKQRARQIFESEMRRRVDPGIVEHVSGNVFNTRVYPIDPAKTRTVRITYLSNLESTAKVSTWTLPLAFMNPLKTATVRVDVLNDVEPGAIKIDGIKDAAFQRNADRLTAEQKFTDVSLEGTLTVSLPSAEKLQARVAAYVPPTLVDMMNTPGEQAIENYFFITAQPAAVEGEQRNGKGMHVGVIFDTSLSRGGADKTAEKEFLKGLAENLPKWSVLDRLTLDDVLPAVSHPMYDAKETPEWTGALTYDGALRIDGFRATRTSKTSTHGAKDYDFYVFISDGHVTLGKPEFAEREVPIYTVCSDAKANHGLLRKLAQESGGLYLNLQTLKPAEAVTALLGPRAMISIEADTKEIADIYPARLVPVVAGQRVLITGRLLAEEATVTLKQAGAADQVVTLKRTTAADRLIPRAWAMQRIADLSMDADTNGDALMAVGKKFSLVTPLTSLIVLETLEQYLQHKVVPPPSQEEMYKQFAAVIGSRRAEEKKDEAEKIQRVMTLWRARTAWWDQKFEYAADFKLKEGKRGEASGAPGTVAFSDGHAEFTRNPGAATPVVATTGPTTRAAGDVLRDTVAIDNAKSERVGTVYHFAIKQANERAEANQWDAAVNQAQQAIAIIDANRGSFSESEANSLRAAAQSKLQEIMAKKSTWDKEQSAMAAKRAEADDRARARMPNTTKSASSDKLMADANALVKSQQYPEAAATLREALILDPTNTAAQLSLTIITDRINYRALQRLSQKQAAESIRQELDNKETLIPYADLLVYPENWVEQTRSRTGGEQMVGLREIPVVQPQQVLMDQIEIEHGNRSNIAIKAWSPDTPYMKAIRAAKPEDAYGVYLEQRKQFLALPASASPGFYLDCGNYFLESGKRADGIRIISNIAQLRLGNAALLRVAAYRLLQVGQYDDAIDLFEKVAKMRPEEPQSFRDLAVAYAQRGIQKIEGEIETHRIFEEKRLTMQESELRDLTLQFMDLSGGYRDLGEALRLYNKVIMTRWERFNEIEVVALMEANALLAKVERYNEVQAPRETINTLDARLVKNLECDIRIVMTWDADSTDIDLHVLEPSGEEAFYSNNRTTIGGLISRDFTQGYGPEEYCVRRAMAGKYKIVANYFGSNGNSVQGPVTVQATVITNFGRANEKREAMTLRLTDRSERVAIGEVTFGGK